MELQTGKLAATRQSWSRDSIRKIIAEIQAANPRAGHKQLVKLTAERMREDDDALIAAADYAVTAALNAQDDYRKRQSGRSQRERAQREARIEATAESIKNQILLLNLEMPNGKRMRYCTGGEMAAFGKGYARIAKKAGNKLVGQVLDEAGVRKLMG